MPFPIALALGLGVVVASTCAAWILNEMTEEERRTQGRERRRQQDMRNRYAHDRDETNEAHRARLASLARSHLDNSLKLLKIHAGKQKDIEEGIVELRKVFLQEMAADSTSPARNSVLRREYCRIDDAHARLQAYSSYLESEKHSLENMFRKEKYSELIDRDLPQPLLPAEWLYPGKLVLVGLHELNSLIPPFQHKLVFGHDENHKQIQRALAVESGDEIPVLVMGQHKENKGIFFACVARGKLKYEYMRQGLPAPMEVERSVGTGYLCSMYNGAIRAYLPRTKENLRYVGLNYLPGQKVSLYPELFDLCLKNNPFDSKSKSIQVSEYPPAEMGNNFQLDLYMELDESLLSEVDDETFYSSETRWTVMDFNAESGILLLGKGNVLVEAEADIEAGVLAVLSLRQTSKLQVGMDTDFNLNLISEKLEARELVGWKEGLGEFLRVALQMSLGKEQVQAREQQAKMMRRWQSVVEYQILAEHYAEVEFSACAVRKDTPHLFDLLVPLAEVDKRVDEETTVRELYNKAFAGEKYSPIHPERCFKIERWDPQKGRFFPVMKESATRRAQYTLEDDGLRITGAFFQDEKVESLEKYRLSVRVPSGALDKQLVAIDDFFNDRLVNPKVKDVLLAPSTYSPPQNSEKKPERQFFGVLNNSQKSAVSLALSPSCLSLIQGPPGTGKTTVIVEIIRQLVAENPAVKILVVSQQNAAVDNALSRYVRVLSKNDISSDGVVRVGDPKKIDGENLPLHIDAVLERFTDKMSVAAGKAQADDDGTKAALASQWMSYLESLSSIKYGPHPEEMFITLLADKQVVGATCVGLASRKAGIDNLKFDIAIIDEAGRSTVPELLIPMMRANKVVLIGDHNQLPPSIAPLLREDAAKEAMDFLREDFLDSSFFERLFEALPPECKVVLDKQFRMPPVIGDLVADLFYKKDGVRLISNGDAVACRDADIFSDSLYWFDVKGRQESESGTSSWLNRKEAKAILYFILWLKEHISSSEEVEVAVITPYGGQKRHLCDLLSREGKVNAAGIRIGALHIRVDTVHAFQGSEADIVFYSSVKTSPPLNFILDKKNLNVACSRAKKHLLFFGDKAFLSSYKPDAGMQNFFKNISERANPKLVELKASVVD